MAVAGRPDSHIERLVGHASVTTTMNHYVKDVGTFRNVFSHSEENLVSVKDLKRVLLSVPMVHGEKKVLSLEVG